MRHRKFLNAFAVATVLACAVVGQAEAHGWGGGGWGGGWRGGWGGGGWGGVGIGIGIAPVAPYYYPPPVYYAPPAYYPPPPPPGYYSPYPGYIAQSPPAVPQNAQASAGYPAQSCNAGNYVCPMEVTVPVGGNCYCRGNEGARVYGSAQ